MIHPGITVLVLSQQFYPLICRIENGFDVEVYNSFVCEYLSGFSIYNFTTLNVGILGK
jgi:hypothetical protein